MSRWFDMDGPVDSVSADDRGLAYGDGLFETIAIRNGKPRLWQRHMDRLEASCARLSIPFPGIDSLSGLLKRAVADSGYAEADATAKLVLTAGIGQRGYTRPRDLSTTVRLGVFPCRVPDAACYREGIDLVVCETRLSQQAALAGMKTLNRLEQVLGRMEIGSAFEGVMCDADKRVICGTMSNVFIAKDNRLATPRLDRCGVEGVTRAELLERAKSANVDIDVRDIPLHDCRQADEIMLANSQFGLLRARSIDETRLEQTDAFEQLRGLLAEAGFDEYAQ
ncbi:MAG: aminodeoxychorismate lyase [Woeseiaceae bacterium]|nr:aminodeoxychorismate lyase [Woeseiaceae bacterium]